MGNRDRRARPRSGGHHRRRTSGPGMARAARRAGRSVVIANSRGPESLTPMVAELDAGVSAATPEQAAAAPIVVSPCRGTACPRRCRVSSGTVRSSSTRQTIGAGDDSKGRTSSELVAELVVGARVVKAANTLAAESAGLRPPRIRRSSCHLHFGRRRRREGRRRQAVRGRQGSTGSISGDLSTGGAMQQIHHPLPGVNLLRLAR